MVNQKINKLWGLYEKQTRKNRSKNKYNKYCIKCSAVNIQSYCRCFSHSIAIISDAVNNITDALSSTITIVGTKLAGKAPNKKHPYGYGRIEYLTSLLISVLVLYAGLTAFIESIKKIIHPEVADYSTITLVILAVGILVKFVLSIFVKKKGKAVKSDALIASGQDAFNDALLSISVLVSAVVYILFNISIEAYVGALLSVIIIKSGIELLKEAIDNMIGTRIESNLSRDIKKEILKEEHVKGAFDLILNNYGPDKYLGSVHIELEDTLSVSEIDQISRSITKNIAEKFGVILHTIGVYSINTKDKDTLEIRKDVQKIVFSHEGILQMHGFYVDIKEKTMSFDIIIDFSVKGRENLYKQIYDEVKGKYSDYNLTITLDVDVSD